jgi:RNA polymerase sigma-54 factor
MNIGMHQVLSVGMHQRQQLVMTPAMVQAIRLLQLNSMELEQEVTQEMEENPFLEMVEEEEEETTAPAEGEAAASENGEAEDGAEEETAPVPDMVELDAPTTSLENPEPRDPTDDDATPPDLLDRPDHSDDNDSEIEEFYQETYDDSALATAERPDEERDLSQLDSAGTTLYEHLERQLHVSSLEGKDLEIGEYLIGNIDGNGYLTTTVEEVAERLAVPAEEVERVLQVIQTFDPTGVGARDIRECLLIQIRAMPEPDEALLTLVRDHFDDLAHRRHKAIARAMKIPERRVIELCQRVAKLEPKPGRAVSNETPQYITPDVVVTKIDGKYYISLNEGRTNHLKISSYYRSRFHAVLASGKNSQAADGSPLPDAEYIRKKFSDAVVLIRNIERRKGTILKIAHAIMEKQRDFLEKGIEHLHPMTLKDIAAEVGMHEATVSRVTANKYVETPRGTFRLKFFFSSGLESDDGETQSSRAIRDRIRQMIEGEDPKRPLSDQRIADILRQDGLRIARRTVTKYREQMKILPTNMRRQS